MRIWSIHPKYLDSKGLVALWREALLSQNVLLDKTKGYKNHPQLLRFKEQENPTQSLANYLHYVCDEADIRGYNFNRDKICHKFQESYKKLPVTEGQITYEWQHFLNKIKTRDPERYVSLLVLEIVEPNAIFTIIEGYIEPWEVV